MIRAVVFDLDGTLVDTEDATDQAIVEVMARHGRPGVRLPSAPDAREELVGRRPVSLEQEAAAIDPRLLERDLFAHCHLGLGRLYRRTGQREQAQEHLTTATTMYREMGMTYWLEKAETDP